MTARSVPQSLNEQEDRLVSLETASPSEVSVLISPPPDGRGRVASAVVATEPGVEGPAVIPSMDFRSACLPGGILTLAPKGCGRDVSVSKDRASVRLEAPAWWGNRLAGDIWQPPAEP